jgi:hypothetical protein
VSIVRGLPHLRLLNVMNNPLPDDVKRGLCDELSRSGGVCVVD